MTKKTIALGWFNYKGVKFPVFVHDIIVEFGITRYIVTPEGGQGELKTEAVKVYQWENDTFKEIYLPKINS